MRSRLLFLSLGLLFGNFLQAPNPPTDDSLPVLGNASSVASQRPQRLTPIAKTTVADLMRKQRVGMDEAVGVSSLEAAGGGESASPLPAPSLVGLERSRKGSKKLLHALTVSGGGSRPSTPTVWERLSCPASPASSPKRPIRRLKKIGTAADASRRFKEEQLKKTAEKGGILVDLPPIDSSEEVAVLQVSQAAAWGCDGELTALAVKNEWIALRHRCGLLRSAMMAFRKMYTRWIIAEKPEIILKTADANKLYFDGSRDFFSSEGCAQGLAKIFRFYASARDALNECLPLAAQLFMGHVYKVGILYSTGTPFGDNYCFPSDSVGLDFLNFPSCSRCSQEAGRRVEHSNVILPDALDYDDVCRVCGASIFKRICLGYVCDPESGIATMNTYLQIRLVNDLKLKLIEAANALACISVM